MRSIVYALAAGAVFVAVTLLLSYAKNHGFIEEETMKHSVQVLTGLMLAGYSNFTPKQIGRAGTPQQEAYKQRLLRVSGWSMVLAGLAYAGLWAFAPLDVANIASVAVVLTAMVITLGYAARTVAACRSLAAN